MTGGDGGKGSRALGPREVQDAQSLGANLLDIREATGFGRGHLRGSINIQFSSKSFAERGGDAGPSRKPLGPGGG